MRSTEPAGEELEIWGYSVYCIIDNIYSAEYILSYYFDYGKSVKP